jgi:deoxyribodipyrimidine photolyase
VREGLASKVIANLVSTLNVQAVFAAADYEPLARARDDQVGSALQEEMVGHRYPG